jgi:hypothetical protein
MNRWIATLLCLLVGLSGGIARAEMAVRASKPEVKKEIVAVIDAQLTAFRKGEVRKAYGFAATALRAQKPLRQFSAIVRASYPEIWANTRAEFGLARDDSEHATILVHVFAKASDASYDFSLTKERAGWRIDGVLRHETTPAEKI